MTENEVLLIDFSSVSHPIWHTSSTEPDPDYVSTRIVAKVRALASSHRYAAICCDSGRSFRHDLTPTYKANRPKDENRAVLNHQMARALDVLKADGFPIWKAAGAEADDLLATATRLALDVPDMTVLIASSDKDLLALVCDRVRAKSVMTGDVLDPAGVKEKLGVRPQQVIDYMSLVGDASDNIKGAKGIGPKRAAELLEQWGTLDDLYRTLDTSGPALMRLTPSVVSALQDFRANDWQLTRTLLTMRTDFDVPFAEILSERVPADAADFGAEMTEPEPMPATEETPFKQQPLQPAPQQQAMTVRPEDPDVLAPAPSDWTMQLEPRSYRESRALAADMFASRMFSAYGNQAAVLSTIMAGRELGLQAMASLRSIHVVEGRPTLAADLIRALVIRSGKAKYFRCTERTNEAATFETQRGDDPPISLRFTVEDAKVAGLVKEKSAWVKSPADQCVARASAKLARLVYPDVVHGIYETGEGEDMR